MAAPPRWGACDEMLAHLDARCGWLTVPENRAFPRKRSIDLRLVILPARGPEAAADPVFFLAGGPGEAAGDYAVAMAEELAPLRAHRDLVFVDQRGTGGSNPLACEPEAGSAARFLPGPRALRRCARRLARRADLRQYTTTAAARDLDAVRAALGYGQIDLYGLSYGTQLAQVYLRLHGDRVRSAVLAAPAPLAAEPILFYARDAERALGRLRLDCAADPACAQAYPRLGAELDAVLERLGRTPVRVEAADPPGSAPEPILFDRAAFAATLRTRLYSTSAAARVPRAVHQAFAGDFSDMAHAALVIRRAHRGGWSDGLFLSVTCGEGVAALAPRAIERLSRGTFLGPGPLLEWRRACDLWPHGRPSPGFADPVRSEVPALLLSGGLDPVLPPYWGEQVAMFLPRGRHLVIDQAAHDLSAPCLGQMIARFVDAGTADGLDTRCANEIRRPPFALPAVKP